jgi:hypothetical protein
MNEDLSFITLNKYKNRSVFLNNIRNTSKVIHHFYYNLDS